MNLPAPSEAHLDVNRSRVVSAAAFIFGLVVLGYRGWNGRTSILPLDVVFVQQSLDPSTPFWGVSTPFGQFDLLRQFSGYLHTVVRVFVELFELAPLTAYPMLTYVASTIIWAGCGWGIFLAVRSIASPSAGFLATAAFALLPASNIILLSQLNALQWPMLAASVVLIATDHEPRTPFGKLAYLGFLVALATNAALAFVPIAMLGWRVVINQNKRVIVGRFVAMILPYVVQVGVYIRQPFRRAEELNPLSELIQEVLYIPKMLLPGALRGVTADPLSAESAILFSVIAFGSTAIILGALRVTRRLHSTRRAVIAELLVVGVLAGVISVVMNGNLNHQYLMIPMTCWWVVIVLSVDSLISTPQARHIGQIAAIIAVGVFIFSAFATWNKDFRDPFFSPPGLVDLSSALDRAQAFCVTNPSSRVDVSGTGLVLPCEIAVSLR